MENKTPAKLQSDRFIRTLRGFRNTLWLQFNQMSRAWRYHDPNDGDADIQTLAKLGTIVESTRVAVSHVLKISGDVLSKQLLQRSDASSDPNPYTSLPKFHRAVRPSSPPYPPLAQKLPYSGSTAGLTSHISSTVRSGRPNDDTSEISTRERKTTVHLTSAARTRPKSPAAPTREHKMTTHLVTRTQQEPNSLLKKPIEQNLPRAMPSLYRSTRMHTPPVGGNGSMPRVRHGATGHLQEEVVVKGARHTPASPNENEMGHANLIKGQSIRIGGHYTGNNSQSKHFARLGRPSSTQALPNNQRTKNTGLDAAPPIISAGSNHYQTEIEALCRPPHSEAAEAKGRNQPRRPNKKPNHTCNAKPPTTIADKGWPLPTRAQGMHQG